MNQKNSRFGPTTMPVVVGHPRSSGRGKFEWFIVLTRYRSNNKKWKRFYKLMVELNDLEKHIETFKKSIGVVFERER